MSDSSPVPFGERHPILKQALVDARQLTWQQVGVPALTTMSAFAISMWNDYSAGHLDFAGSMKTALYSLVLGIALYVLVAIVRAPFVIVGRHHQEMSALRQKIASVTAPANEPQPQTETPKNSFSDFRVTFDSGQTLRCEFWYFYDGALGEDMIFIHLWPLDQEGRRLSGTVSHAGEVVRVVGHKALAEMSFTYRPKEEGTVAESAYLSLEMEANSQFVIFHRQSFPYKKVWKAIDSPPKSGGE